MNHAYYMGVDMGTTSTKAVLYDQQGKVLHTHRVEYPLHSSVPGMAEQDPDEIFHAVKECMKRVIADSKRNAGKHLKLISFSSAMHSLIVVDETGKPMTRCITWADNRASEMASRILTEMDGLSIYKRTGTPIHPMSPLTKIAWLRESDPETFAKAYKFIGIKEYICHRWFGKYMVDYSIASATGLFNLEQLNWDEGAMEIAGITADKLSDPVNTTTVFTGIDQHDAQEIGIQPDTPFVIGASDGVLSNLGVNAIDPGVVAVTIGTSGAIRAVTDKPVTDAKGRTFCYALTDRYWVVGGPVNNGGMTLRWVRDELASAETETAKRLGIDPYEMLTKMASRVAPGSDGLIFHPYLAGERAPLWNADARGSFFGLSLIHKREHMIRSVLEGVILNLYTVLLAVEETIGVPTKIQATGGFARSALWRQMMADIFNHEVHVPESFESSCLGAVILGRYAIGEIQDFSSLSEWVGTMYVHQPNSAHVAVYHQIIPIFARVSQLLQEEYHAIAEYQRAWVKEEDRN